MHVPDFWSEFHRGHVGPACMRESHQVCPHLIGMGGRVNAQKLRLEFGVGLCNCSCHADCPVCHGNVAISFREWRASCTCPGADEMRQRMAETGVEPPDFAELRERARQRSQARREAFKTVRRDAAGKSRDEIRDRYVAELRARGVEPPPEDVVAAIVERIKGNPLPSYKIAGEALFQLGKGAVGIARLIRDMSRPPT